MSKRTEEVLWKQLREAVFIAVILAVILYAAIFFGALFWLKECQSSLSLQSAPAASCTAAKTAYDGITGIWVAQ